MKKNVFRLLLTGALATILFVACNSEGTKEGEQTTTTEQTAAPVVAGQSGVVDDQSQKNVVGIAVGSPDHTTLVTAVKAAELVDALSNAGPFTVFAPTNAAFAKLPAGTVEGLLKPEKKDALQEILQYHVSVGVYKLENLKDGQQIDEVFGGKVTIGVKDGKYTVNGANILATVPASNGVVYVIDQVIFAPAKK
ncbi:MAG: fasciclin domain-containing protein [Bacteroidetes bacterium]|nr:fasciclin domain-containing protein [Bacteroidota bacterium]